MPRIEAIRHTTGYSSASFLSCHAVCKQFVVPRVDVPDVSSNSKFDRTGLQFFRSRRPPDSAGVFLACVLSDCPLLLEGAPGEHITNALRECGDVRGIEALTSFRSAQRRQSGRSPSMRRKRPFPSFSPHSEQAESRTIEKTTISPRLEIVPTFETLTAVGFASIIGIAA